MKRCLVVGGKDPCCILKRMMEIAFPPDTKRSGNVVIALKEEVELRKLNNEWQEDYEGLFGLLKNNSSVDGIKLKGNWFGRTEFNCGAIQFPQTTEELFLLQKALINSNYSIKKKNRRF